MKAILYSLNWGLCLKIRCFKAALPCFSLYYICCVSPLPLSAQCDFYLSNVCGDVQASGGLAPDQPTVFCGGQTVTIVNNSSPADSIDFTFVDWDDGNCQIFPGCPATMTHVYSFPNDTCIAGSGQLTFIIQLGVEKICVDPLTGDSVSSFNFITFPLAVRFEPVALFAVPGTPCAGIPVLLEGLGCGNNIAPEYGWLVNGVPAGSTQDLLFTFPAAGNYEVTYFLSNGCSTDSYTQTVTVLDPPEAALLLESGVINPNIVCISDSGGVVVLNGAVSLNETMYEWSCSPSFGVQWLSDKDTSIVSVKFTQAGTYTVKLKVRNGCNEADEITLILEAIVGEALTLAPQPDDCAPLNYSPSPFSPNAVYTLNGNPMTFPQTLDTGQYVVVGTLTNVCGMQEVADTFQVEMPVPVQITSTAPFDTLCRGGAPVLLSADQPGVTWEGQNISNVGGQTYFTPVATGSFLVQAVYLKNTNCEQRDSAFIFVKNVTATAENIAVCPGMASVALSGSPAGGAWTCAACPGCIQNNTFVFSNYSGGFPVTLTYIVSDGECSAQTDVELTVNIPQAAFSLSTPLCENVVIQADVTGSTATDFEWRINGLPVGGPPFQGLTAGLHTIEQVAVLYGCRDSISQTITVGAPPSGAAFIANATEGCSPLPVEFFPQDSFLTDATYQWQFPGAEPSSANTWSLPDTVVFTNDTYDIGYFTVTYTVTNECGTKETGATIQLNPKPFAELGIDSLDTGCSPLNVIITNRSVGLPDTCVLTFGDGSTVYDCFNWLAHTFYADTQIVFYPLHLWTQNECGVSEWTDTVTVVPPGIEAFFEMDNYSVCPHSEVVFKDASTPVPLSLKWDFGDGGFSNTPNATHVFTIPNDTFEVVLRVSTGCGYDTMRHFIYTLDVPAVAFDLPPVACAGQELKIINQSSPDLYAYYWDFGDGSSDSTNFHGIHTFIDGPDIQTVRLTVVGWNQCANTLEKELDVRAKPVAGFYTHPPEGCAPHSVQFEDTSQNVNQWRWIFEDGTTSEEQFPGKIFDVGAYTVKLIASWDGICTDSVTVFNAVKVEDCNLFIPNVFNPSSTGSNALFTVFGGSELENINRLRVWDRWGTLVYDGFDLPPDQISGWDGRHEGKLMNPGVFVYEAEVRFAGGRVQRFVGDVTLLQ